MDNESGAGMMYVIFPMFWVGMLSWIGINVGEMAKSLSQGGKMSQDAGQQGGAMAKNAATSAATKGLK